MNVLILTNPDYDHWLNDICIDYMSEHLIFLINNKADFERFTEHFSYDIGISFMYQHKVPAKEVNTHTWFNFHPAPLPEYKGRNLCYHAIMSGEKEFGASLHYMDENFDTGDIIKVGRFPIERWYTAQDLSEHALLVSKSLFREYLPRILADEDFLRYPNGFGIYYKKAEIVDTVSLDKDVPLSRFIRAVTYKEFYPKLEIGGVTYKVVRDK